MQTSDDLSRQIMEIYKESITINAVHNERLRNLEMQLKQYEKLLLTGNGRDSILVKINEVESRLKSMESKTPSSKKYQLGLITALFTGISGILVAMFNFITNLLRSGAGP
jgi:hypothetical protein